MASALIGGSIAPAMAVPVLTEEEAAAKVLASGFSRVARAEAKRDAAIVSTICQEWDVWAYKDGIAYMVTIDSDTGRVLAATPAVADD